MKQEPTKDETDRRAREIARRLPATPPQPKVVSKRTPKPTRSGASEPGKPGQAGEASYAWLIRRWVRRLPFIASMATTA